MSSQSSSLTRAEQLIPHRTNLGRGVEAILVLPGSSAVFIERSTDLIARSFSHALSARSLGHTVDSWRYAVTEKISGTSRLKSDAPIFDNRHGVVDCVVAYYQKSEIVDPLGDPSAELMAVHGLFHFSDKPSRFFGLEWAVDPKFRQQGLGTKVFAHNLCMSTQLGGLFRWTYTDADEGRNAKIIEKYRNWGFKKTPFVFELGGAPQVTMALSLRRQSPARKLMELAFQEGPPIR